MAKKRISVTQDTANSRIRFVATRLTPKQHDKYKRYADKCGISMSMLIEMALEKHFNQMEE